MPRPAAKRRVEIYTRAGCHLCDEAARMLERIGKAAGFEPVAVDIDGDDELAKRYMFEIPVVAVDGEPVARWPFSEGVLEEAVMGALGGG